jgi:hypothetical protein
MLYVKGRPYPYLVVVKNCNECEWVVHANRYKNEVFLDKGWLAFASFHDLKEADYVMFNVTVDRFKMTMYDPTTSCENELICHHPSPHLNYFVRPQISFSDFVDTNLFYYVDISLCMQVSLQV